jgi:hypothetical protein
MSFSGSAALKTVPKQEEISKLPDRGKIEVFRCARVV